MRKYIVFLLAFAVLVVAAPSYAAAGDVKGQSNEGIAARVGDWFATRGKSDAEKKAILAERKAKRAVEQSQKSAAKEVKKAEKTLPARRPAPSVVVPPKPVQPAPVAKEAMPDVAVGATQPPQMQSAVPAAQPMQQGVVNAQEPPKVMEQAKLTKAEIITRINEILKNRPNVIPMIQGLEEVKTEGGASSFLYNKKKIEDLDEETLNRLLAMINQQISLENLQRLDRQQRQLRNLKQIEDVNKQQRQLRQLNQLNKSQKTYKAPPKAPKTYRAPGK